jgi:hypothetical protein
LSTTKITLPQKVFIILPPFTQLNTPYPSTAYLKGFLDSIGVKAAQADLGIEVILEIFSAPGLEKVFNQVESKREKASENSKRMIALKKDYIATIDLVIAFLQHKNPSLAHAICENDFLPRASRFTGAEDLEWAFGTMGIQDKARHLASLYLDDLSDLIREMLDPHFGFSRYAESLGRSASSFDELDKELQMPDSFTSGILLEILAKKIENINPSLVAISVPFPGNLFAGLKCGQWIKRHYPNVKVALGGGFANTELRSLGDPNVFKYIDFVTLDDGEAPLRHLLEFLDGRRSQVSLMRTFALQNGVVTFFNGSAETDYPQAVVGMPSYDGLPLRDYLSVIELANPMHSLWSNGRWNKLTLAHGCYWKKCTFCDISLDYIRRYEQTSVPLLCDRIEQLIRETGENGFHFVDEAAPPALLRDLALEILRRDLKVVWWTNIRFEKSFTRDLCRLLKASGCIAMSGGLEVASDRLLELIDKGVTVEQVARVCRNFTNAGILVHAYLMYGYPTQTAQETVDSLEMVRQLFEQGIIQSGFWHRFAMTAHSPVGINPAKYKAKLLTAGAGTFANNDLEYEEEGGVDHGVFSEGLRISLYNYMHGAGFDLPLSEWFEDDIPRTRIPKNYIDLALNKEAHQLPKPSSRVVFLGNIPSVEKVVKNKKGNATTTCRLRFVARTGDDEIMLQEEQGTWLAGYFLNLVPAHQHLITFKQFRDDFESRFPNRFDEFWSGPELAKLRFIGLLILS